MILWNSMQSPPADTGLYVVYAPSDYEVRPSRGFYRESPFVRVAWWEGRWLDLPYGWGRHVTHWAPIAIPRAA